MNTNNMVWNVYYHNFNQNKIEVKNIFSHGSFRKDVVDALWMCKVKWAFAEELRMELAYYFRSRAEWEIVIKPWCGGGDYKGIKIDVYDQVMLNFDIFVDYCWSFKDGVQYV